MNHKKLLSVVMAFLLISNCSIAQEQADTLYLNVEQAIELAVKNNPDLKRVRLATDLLENQIKGAKSAGLSQVSGSAGITDNFSIAQQLLPGEIFGEMGQIPVQFGVRYGLNAGVEVSQLIYSREYLTNLKKISSPVITVSTAYPGAGPTEVESAVTKPIENILSSLENLEGTQAISMESFSTVIVELKYGADVDKAVQDAQRKLDGIIGNLPDDVTEPTIGKFSFDEMPIMRLGATSTMEDVKFTKIFYDLIQPELARIEGVAQVNIIGGADREININVDGNKLMYYNLSILQISQAIGQSNLNFPTGSIKDKDQDILVRLSGKIQDLEQLRNLILTTTPEGSQVLLKDVAEVYDTKKETETISRINGNPSLGVTISKQNDGNTVEVSKNVQLKIAELEERYGADNLKFEIANDSSVFTLEADCRVGKQ